MINLNDTKKVYVALSGGVDSAVSACLLKKAGYDVTGVFMKNWSGDDFGIQADCPWEEEQRDAEAVCKHLDIPFRSFNFEKEYRSMVVDYFFDEYKKGRTPNPDVMCNKEIKFKLFLNMALEEGADYIATGHYAQRGFENNGKEYSILDSDNNWISSEEGRYFLVEGNDDTKNQVYFLYNITQEQLSKTIFPIGDMPKSKVRELAKEFGLPNAEKPDSQGICFIGKINVLQFLMSEIPKKKGDIIDKESGEKVGEHDGIYFYTIGQRARISGQETPYYYCGKNLDENIMYVCHGEDNPLLYGQEVVLEDFHWIAGEENNLENLSAVVRYRQKPQPGKLLIDGDKYKFIFDEPQRAIASGQSLVMFSGKKCLGGGVIH